jgi:catechol 2,3-dioxygenase-like lactoylglutathione lyase family enzyme
VPAPVPTVGGVGRDGVRPPLILMVRRLMKHFEWQMKIDGIDHIVLTVKDIETTCAFYGKVLGMDTVSLGDGKKALLFGNQKINLHQHASEFEPKANKPTPGSADVCFTTSVRLREVIAHLAACGVELIEGPVRRRGARGPIVSVYFRDPDLNLIEVCNYEGASPRHQHRLGKSG